MAGIIEKKVTIRDKEYQAGFIVSDEGLCFMDYISTELGDLNRCAAVRKFGETQVMRAEDRGCQP